MNVPGHGLVRVIAWLVPAWDRDEWEREWHAELCYSWNLDGPHRRGRLSAYLRCLGALEDALWLRIRKRDRGMFLQDIRFALRAFARAPGFTLVVLVTLALGIGANSAIFTLVDMVLLRPLPVHEPEQLADVWTTCRRGFAYCSSSYPDYLDYADRNRTFAGLSAFFTTNLTQSGDGETRLVEATLATGNYFTLLGVGAAAGRVLGPADDRLADPAPVVVLSHRAWMREYGGDPDVIGSTIRLNNVPFTIVGVAPSRFRGTRITADPTMWIPMTSLALVAPNAADMLDSRDTRAIGGMIGRRLPGVTVEQAQADMLSVSDQLQEEFPGRDGRRITVEGTRSITLPAAETGTDVIRFVAILMAVVAAALLIACANIANLLLARASARRREIGVRIALGAGRSRLVRQLLTESVLLSVTGAAFGLFVASTVLRFFSGYALPGFVSIASLDLHLDARVLAFTGVIALVTGVIFGLVPALQTSNPNLTEALKHSSADNRGHGMMRTRGVLLSIQTALALTLLIGAGLFIQSLRNGLNTDVGFRARQVAMAAVSLPSRDFTDAQREQFITAVLDRAAGFPTATRVAGSVQPPLSQGGQGFLVNVPPHEASDEFRIEANWVTPDFFATLGIPLRSGRGFTDQDRSGTPIVAVINETMATRWWPGEEPVGRRFRMNYDGSGPEVEIVGVARDVKDGLTEDPEPFIYYAMAQHIGRVSRVNLIVGTDDDAAAVLPMLRSEIRNLAPNLPIRELSTLSSQFAEFLMPQRMGSLLLTTLGALTVLLAVVGITGVVTYAVNQREREIGIRLALGAARGHILRVIATGAMVPVAIGIVLGVAGSLGVTRLLVNFMFGVTATDPLTFIAVPAFLGAVAAVAALLPANRATRLSPTEALRSQ